MENVVVKKLEDEYNALETKKKETCIKYYINYNNKINVNLYYDNYDINNPNIVMIIKFDKDFYFTNLSYRNNHFSNFINFLDNKSSYYGLLIMLLDENNKLDKFFDTIKNSIINNNKIITLYSKDKIFTKAMKNNHRINIDLPFIKTIKKANMTPKMYNRILETTGVSIDLLNRFRDAGYTFVRTDDPAKRSTITFLLNKYQIN